LRRKFGRSARERRIRKDAAVFEGDDTISFQREGWVVRGEEDRKAFLSSQPLEESDDGFSGGFVEIARGFVGDEDLRIHHEGSGNRDTLHLTSREFAREMSGSVGEAYSGENFVGLFRVGVDAQEDQRQFDVLPDSEGGEQRELLEDEP